MEKMLINKNPFKNKNAKRNGAPSAKVNVGILKLHATPIIQAINGFEKRARKPKM